MCQMTFQSTQCSWVTWGYSIWQLIEGDLNAHVANDSKTWRDVIGRNGLPYLNLSGAQSKTMFKHKHVHKCTQHQNTLGRRSMSNLGILYHWICGHMFWILGDKRSCQLVNTRWWVWGGRGDIVRVFRECLEEVLVLDILTPTSDRTFYSILREAGACPNLLSPTHTSSIEEAEYRDQGNNFPITEAVKLWLNLWLGPLGGWGSA